MKRTHVSLSEASADNVAPSVASGKNGARMPVLSTAERKEPSFRSAAAAAAGAGEQF